jgi:hypothetical protein
VDEHAVLSALLEAHIAYQPGVGAKHHALRAYADAGAAQLALLIKRQPCPVGGRGAALLFQP